jgi:hypothetical protein
VQAVTPVEPVHCRLDMSAVLVALAVRPAPARQQLNELLSAARGTGYPRRAPRAREALDPGSGEELALPDDRELLADLTAP